MKKFIILFVLILSTFHLYAETVNIKFFLQTGEILEKEINANTRLLQINDNFFPESKLYDDFLIVDIEGLEDLSQLKILQINDVNNIDDFAFLSRLINLQELYAKPFVQTLFSKNNELSSNRFCLQSVCYQTCFVNFIRCFVAQPLMNPFTIEELYKFPETFSQFLCA